MWSILNRIEVSWGQRSYLRFIAVWLCANFQLNWSNLLLHTLVLFYRWVFLGRTCAWASFFLLFDDIDPIFLFLIVSFQSFWTRWFHRFFWWQLLHCSCPSSHLLNIAFFTLYFWIILFIFSADYLLIEVLTWSLIFPVRRFWNGWSTFFRLFAEP